MKHCYFHVLWFVLFILPAERLKAQAIQDINGKPLPITSYTDITGSAFLFDDWLSGTVKLSNGTFYDNLSLKYDEYLDKLYYKNDDGSAFEFIDGIDEFSINTNNIIRHFIVYRNANYELLADGAVKFLKKNIKELQDISTYGTAVKTKKFSERTAYFLLNAGRLMPVKRDKKSVLTALGDKQTALAAYLNAGKINFRNEADIARLINYYNTL